MKVTAQDSKTFTIRHINGVKTMVAKAVTANPIKNIIIWQFKHPNGMMKYFEMFDQGLAYYETKGW